MISIILAIVFLIAVVYSGYRLINVFQSLDDITPQLLTFIAVSYIFTVIWVMTVFPNTGNIFWNSYQTVVGWIPVSKGVEIQEGFLLEQSRNPALTDYVISRQSLIQKIEHHLFQTTLPNGLKSQPNGKGPSRLAIEGYLKRIYQQLPSRYTLNDAAFHQWVSRTERVFTLVSREQYILRELLGTIVTDTRAEYYFNDLRDILEPLLRFYDIAKIEHYRFRSRRDVDEMFGLPLGERDPRNETAFVGTNATPIKTSTNDTGDIPERPTDLTDPMTYFPGRPIGTDTNTDELVQLGWDIGTRGGNS